MKEYSYTSILSIVRTACTETQCLYKGALYFYGSAAAGSPVTLVPGYKLLQVTSQIPIIFKDTRVLISGNVSVG